MTISSKSYFQFFGYVPRSGVAGSYGSSILIFFRNLVLFFIMVYHFIITPTAGILYIHILYIKCSLFSEVWLCLGSGHSNSFEMVSHIFICIS